MNKIREYLNEHNLPESGYVLLTHAGEPFGWTKDIQNHDPSKVKPGTVACDIENPANIWEALGGDEMDGAEIWGPFPQ